MQLAYSKCSLVFFDGLRGCHVPFCCISGIRYLLCMLHAPIVIGLPLHVTITLSSLWTVTPSFVNIEIVPASEVLPKYAHKCGKSSNVSVSVSSFGRCGMGSVVTLVPVLTSPFATPTLLVERHSIGSPVFLCWSC